MPLCFIEPDKPTQIKSIGGKTETKRFLGTLGFVAGSEVTVISKEKGSLIVNVKNSRIALSDDMARTIFVV